MQVQVDHAQLKKAQAMAKGQLDLLQRRRDSLAKVVASQRQLAGFYTGEERDLDAAAAFALADYYQTLEEQSGMEHQVLNEQVEQIKAALREMESPILVPHLAHKPRGTA